MTSAPLKRKRKSEGAPKGNRYGAKLRPKLGLTKKLRARLARLLGHKKTPHPLHVLAMKNPYNVAPKQVWFNVDRRAGTNPKAGPVAVQVHRLEPPYALCYVLGPDGKFDRRAELKATYIRLDLFRPAEPPVTRSGGGSRGWRLKESA